MLFKSLKILFIVVYSLLAAEGLLRIIAYVPMMPRYVAATPYGVRANLPNQVYRHSTADYNVLIQTNSKGIRSERDIPYEKPPHLKRIVLLGDSFGMGYGVNADEMFTARMTHYLKSKYGLEVEVINLSTSGHGNAEELIALLNEGFKYSPDLVLLVWHYTDLDDNVRSSLFKVVDGKLVKKANSFLPGVKEREFLNQFFVYRFLAERSQVYNLTRNWAGTKVKRWLVKAHFKRPSKNQVTSKRKRKPRKILKGELTVALLERIEQVSQAHGSRFLILDIPFRSSREEFISRFPYKYTGDANPFAIVSPIDVFNQNTDKLIYWEKSAGHFTPFGCDLVGGLLSDYIHKHNMLETPDHSMTMSVGSESELVIAPDS